MNLDNFASLYSVLCLHWGVLKISYLLEDMTKIPLFIMVWASCISHEDENMK